MKPMPVRWLTLVACGLAVAAVILAPGAAMDSAPTVARSASVTIESRGVRQPRRRQALPRRVVPLPPASWRLPLARVSGESPPLSFATTGRYLILVTSDRVLVAVDTATREVAWRHAAADLGVTPRTAAPSDSESVTILGEPGEPPVVVSAATGRVLRRWPRAGPELLQSGCFLASYSLVSAVDSAAPLSIHDAVGTLRKRMDLPWSEYRAGSSHPLLRQLLLAADRRANRCIVALVLGDGLATLSDQGGSWTARYREPYRAPRVMVRTSRNTDGSLIVESQLTNRTRAAFHLATGNGIAYVAFEGTTADAGRIVDAYSLLSGTYLGTLRFARAVRGIAAAGQRLYVAAYDEGRPVLEGYDLPPGPWAGVRR